MLNPNLQHWFVFVLLDVQWRFLVNREKVLLWNSDVDIFTQSSYSIIATLLQILEYLLCYSTLELKVLWDLRSS